MFAEKLTTRFGRDAKPPYATRFTAGDPLAQGLCFATLLNELGGVRVQSLVDGVGGTFAGTVLPSWSGQYWNPGTATGSPRGVNFGATMAQTVDLGLGAFTLAARVLPSASFSTSGGLARRNDGNTVNAGWEVLCASNGTTLSIERATTNLAAKTNASISTSAGVWTTVVVVYLGDLTAANVKIYYNGQLQTINTAVNGTGVMGSDAAQSFILGEANFTQQSTAAGPFQGLMDYCYIWRRALIPSEVYQLQADPYSMFRETLNFNVGPPKGGFPALWLS